MYESTASLELHRLSRQSLQSLQKLYESDEEDVSESDTGGPDLVPSLVGSQRADTLDSDLSADENSHIDPESDREHEEPLFPSYSTKRPRPASMDTVKRRSDVTFVDNTRVFDPEKEMILELPSPESSPGLSSSLFLQPTVYTAPNTNTTPPRRSRSASPSSIFSMESAEIQVAQSITLLEPPTRPTLVFINSLGPRSKTLQARPVNARSRNARNRESRVFDGRLETGFDFPRVIDMKPPTPPESVSSGTERKDSTTSTPDMSTLHEEETQLDTPPSATIGCLSDLPQVPYHPASPRMRPQSIYQPRPRTAGGSDQPFQTPTGTVRGRHTTEASRRPRRIRTTSNNSVYTHSPSASCSGSPYLDTLRQGYMPDYYSDAGFSRTASPVSISSSASTSAYTLSSTQEWQSQSQSQSHGTPTTLSQRMPTIRRMGRKHSEASSIHSLASVRSEINLHAAAPWPPWPSGGPGSGSYHQNSSQHLSESKVTRKSSQRRHARHNSSAAIARGFMGLRFGKKGSNKA